MTDIVDLSKAIPDPMDVPCCPLCDEPINEDEPYLPFIAHECICIAHVFCIAEKRNELEI